MRIVYCINSIHTFGGVERITISKANALSCIGGNEVWIISLINRGKPAFPIDKRVHIIYLDVNYYQNDWKLNKLKQLWNIYIKKKEHKKKLKEVLISISPDIVISTSGMEKELLPSLSGISFLLIRELHKTSKTQQNDAISFIDKTIHLIGHFLDYSLFIQKYDKIVVLTQEDKDGFWSNNEKVIVIPNPITISHSNKSSLTNKRVIAVGRLTKQKNFSSLVRSWDIVQKTHHDWTLDIWGEGPQRNLLQHSINTLELQNSIFLKGVTNDIFNKMKESSIFVLSSLYEGFGLVITEAMSCGLPVVSYACPCGPKDIITESKDGFLVPVGDEHSMAERINYLIEHEDVRQQMGAAALEKSKQYSMDIIIQKWMTLFRDY